MSDRLQRAHLHGRQIKGSEIDRNRNLRLQLFCVSAKTAFRIADDQTQIMTHLTQDGPVEVRFVPIHKIFL
jgi:hypothetical protein